MENEHLEAQNRLDEIKRILADSDKTAPVPSGMLYVIGLTAIFLDLVMDWVFASPYSTFDSKLAMSIAILAVVSTIAVFASKLFIHKENNKLERIFSNNQRFIISIYSLCMVIGSAITMGVVVLGGWALIYFYWSIILGGAAYVFGFFTKKLLSKYGMFLIITSVIQIIGAVIYIKLLIPSPCDAGAEILPLYEEVYHFGLISSIVLVGLGHIFIGYRLGKQ